MIGIAAGVGCFFAAVHVKKTFGYDDSLDAFGVHAVGGIIGAMLTGVFASKAINSAGKGWLIDGNCRPGADPVRRRRRHHRVLRRRDLRDPQVIDIIIGVRVSQAVEVEGLDINLHGEVVPVESIARNQSRDKNVAETELSRLLP